MRNVKVLFEVSYTQVTCDKFIGSNKPDFVFEGDFDKDDDDSFSKLCDLEYRVEQLVANLRSLNCQVIAIRKEISSFSL